MIKKGVLLFVFIGLFSCKKKSELLEVFICNSSSFSNLEVVEDVQHNFEMEIPNHWKTNLYFDQQQSAIIAADTTKNLTETVMIDVTAIKGKLKFDTTFFKHFKSNLQQQKLIETSSNKITFLEKPTYYSRAINNSGKYPLETLHLFIQTTSNNYLHATAKVYGDSLVNKRLCSAISLFEKIKITGKN